MDHPVKVGYTGSIPVVIALSFAEMQKQKVLSARDTEYLGLVTLLVQRHACKAWEHRFDSGQGF